MSEPPAESRFGPYIVGETIGRGNFGKVKLGTHEKTGHKVALKVMPLKHIASDPKASKKIARELSILRMLHHPNIVQMFDVCCTSTDLVLILEYISGGELFDLIAQSQRLDESTVRFMFQQFVSSVYFCHQKGISHRDLKPENVLVEKNGTTVKISDFGLSSAMKDGRFLHTSCGTPNYAAPEVITGHLYNGFETDAWSIGVVLYTMLTGQLPFEDESMSSLFKKIQRASFTIPEYVSAGAQDVIKRLLVVDPLQRATLEQILKHPWLTFQFPSYLRNYENGFLHEFQRGEAQEYRENGSLTSQIINTVAYLVNLAPSSVYEIVQAQAKRPQESPSKLLTPQAVTPSASPKVDSIDSEIAKLVQTLEISDATELLRDTNHDIFICYKIIRLQQLCLRCFGDLQKETESPSSTPKHFGAINGSFRQNSGAGIPPVIPGMPPLPSNEVSPIVAHSFGTSAEVYNKPAENKQGSLVFQAKGQQVPISPVQKPSPVHQAPPPPQSSGPIEFPQTPTPSLGPPRRIGKRMHDVRTNLGSVGSVPLSLDMRPNPAPVQTRSTPSTPSTPQTHERGAMKPGLLIEGNAEDAMKRVYAALKNVNMLWAPISPFSVVAIRVMDHLKVFVSLYRVPPLHRGDRPQYMVDLRLSEQSPITSMDGLFDIFEALLEQL